MSPGLLAPRGFPAEFFEEDDIELLNADGVSFRSMTKMTAKQRDAAVAAGSIAFVLNDWVDQKFDLVDPNVPDYRGATPEAAALSLRQSWGLGEQPIKNMVHLLESNGIRVFSLAENCVEVDAYSVWRGPRPFIFLNMGKSGERRRFDAAHELAHLVLHRHGCPNGVEAEKEAHAFAGAFLMPTASIKAIGPCYPDSRLHFAVKETMDCVSRRDDVALTRSRSSHLLSLQSALRGIVSKRIPNHRTLWSEA